MIIPLFTPFMVGNKEVPFPGTVQGRICQTPRMIAGHHDRRAVVRRCDVTPQLQLMMHRAWSEEISVGGGLLRLYPM